ncbi:MAG: hypothetical protein JOZ70_01635 [Pseudolabrys sp.]|nr:hypothetical protein [Pseudolabrys sp.]MBV9953926.1 hypothetical protein [Pseudolabrys sp.]
MPTPTKSRRRPTKKAAGRLAAASLWRAGLSGFSGPQIAVLFVALTLLISIPIWTHPVPPLSDYVNHLSRMHAIAVLARNPQLAAFYEVNWQVIPNLTMDLIVPVLAQGMSVYLAGQIFMVGMFALIISGALALNRVLIGRWTVLPLFAIPLLYNYVFLIGLMNYLFGVGVSLWALAGWIALRDRIWPYRFALSVVSVLVLFFCHLSALGIYGIGVLSYEALVLWQQRRQPWPKRIAIFVSGGLPFLAALPLLYFSPTLNLASAIYWDQRGKIDGLFYVISVYSDLTTFALAASAAVAAVWAVRHRLLRFHPLAVLLLAIGTAIYLALPRVMFETYMADQRVPIGVAFMLIACGALELRRRLVRRTFVLVLILLIGVRLIEIDFNWTELSDTTSQFRSSVRRIQPGSKVFVAYADRATGDDVRDLGLVHAACLALIERSALVTTVFTVVGKQVMQVKPDYADMVDTHDGTPPSVSQLLIAADRGLADGPAYWNNWTKFDYLYVLFTDEDAPNPDPQRLRMIVEGDRFQLYRILRPH